MFPPELLAAPRERWPQLDDAQLVAITEALRGYFLAHLDAGRRAALAMPSQAADALWHAFILDTRAYHAFCERAFGHYFHHVPEWRTAQIAPRVRDRALERIWDQGCRQMGMGVRAPDRLPALFALDAALALPEAVRYDRDALRLRWATRCVGGDGGTVGFACNGGCNSGDAGTGSDGGCCGDGSGCSSCSSCGGGGD